MTDAGEKARSIAEARPIAEGMLGYIARSMTPFHAVRETIVRLEKAGFARLDERERWKLSAGDKRYVVRGGSTILAFVAGSAPPSEGGFRMIGAHTDSPNLRVKPRPDAGKSGYRQVGVEVYGAPLLSTWMDRDLSLAGRVVFSRGDAIETKLVDFEKAIARVPNVAIHLNRGVNSDGLVLNTQKHMVPVLGLGEETAFVKQLADLAGEDAGDVLGFDLMLYDVVPPTLGGTDGELVFAPRLDNLGSCYTSIEGLIASSTTSVAATRLVVLYDHEECGSRSAVGAQGTVLRDTARRIVFALEADDGQTFERAMRASLLVSADMSHAVHPNYSDLHEPQHQPKLGDGLVIKINANQSYATNGETAARFALACKQEGTLAQHYVVRTDMPCGSTIGSITAANLGIDTVDVGAPMLSMHSCREMAATADVASAIRVYKRMLES